MISDSPLTVVFRNFYRNRMTNLTAKSVKHFLPHADVHCLTLYKESMDEYASQEPLLDFITQFTAKTKYVSGSNHHDGPGGTSGCAHPDNGSYFCEGFNLIYDHFRESDQKLLMLAEDHYFTTGAVLKELVENDWDVAFASGYEVGLGNANGSILGIVPTKVAHLFPMAETTGTNIEVLIGRELLLRMDPVHIYQIVNRRWVDYCGDGQYTNNSDVIEQDLRNAGII
jgi:hypothetical protein